jgi:uncharacterized protein YkwD
MAHSIGRRRTLGPAAMLLAAALVLGFAPARSEAATRHAGRRMHMVTLTNADREHHRLHDLKFNAKISRYAKKHSRLMAKRGYLYHSSTPTLQRVLAPYAWSIGGENVGVGGSLNDLEDAFMASKEHRQNILRKTFDHVAVGIVRRSHRLWVTVIFYG